MDGVAINALYPAGCFDAFPIWAGRMEPDFTAAEQACRASLLVERYPSVNDLARAIDAGTEACKIPGELRAVLGVTG